MRALREASVLACVLVLAGLVYAGDTLFGKRW